MSGVSVEGRAGDPEDSDLVDRLVSTFETSAREAFTFLIDDDYTVTSEHDVGQPPSRVAVRFDGSAVVVESELNTASDEACTVSTFVRADDGDHVLGPATAQADGEIARVLEDHASEVRDILGPS